MRSGNFPLRICRFSIWSSLGGLLTKSKNWILCVLCIFSVLTIKVGFVLE